MIARALFLATALLASCATHALAQTRNDVIAAPALRANVQVSGDLVRIGDIIDNAGSAGQIAIYRAPDLGTTGSLPVAQVLNALRAHQVIGVDTRKLKEISVTRLARTLESKDIETAGRPRAGTQERPRRRRQSQLTFDRDPGDIRLEPPTPAACRRPSCATTPATAASTSPSKSPARTARRRPNCASPAPRSRPSRPRCWRAASSAMKSSNPPTWWSSAAQGRSRHDRRPPRPRGRHAGPPPAPRRPGDQDRRSRQARSRAARPGRDADLRGRPASTSPCAARRWRTAPKATSST